MPQVNIAPASRGANFNHRYHPISVASLDFGELLCSRFIECEKSDSWNHVSGDGFLRLAALDFPAYGRSFIKSAAFFVPYYQVLENYDGIRANNAADRGVACVIPQIRSSFLNELLYTSGYYSLVATKSASDLSSASGYPTPGTYDFVNVINNNSAPSYKFCKLTATGRRAYKFFKMLGYDLYSFEVQSTYSSVVSKAPYVSFLNVLAYAKMWCDYFCNLHLYQSNLIVQFLRAVKCGKDFSYSGSTYYTASTGLVTVAAATAILTNVLVPWESNLYSEAWNSLSSPIGSVSNDKFLTGGSLIGFKLPQESSNTTNDFIDHTVNGVYSEYASKLDLQMLSQHGLNALGSLFDFIKRNNLFGSEAAKQAFARFGIKGEDFTSYFCHKLYENSQEIDYSAVMSNSNTVNGANGSFLGAYAGVGIGSMNFDYDYKCADYGIIFNINWIQVVPMQLHGFDPSVMRLSAFDWWTPELDGKASRAIPLMEVTSDKQPNDDSSNRDTSVYGFCGLYDEYRQMRDVVLGDFVSGNASKFLFARDISNRRINFTTPILPQSTGIQYFNRWGNQQDLTDPFQFDVTNGDRFYLQIKWTIEATRQILSITDSLDLNGAGDIPTSTSPTPNA